MPQEPGGPPPRPPKRSGSKTATNVQLGDFVKDTLTGLEGIAIVELTHITGCHQFKVQPKLNEKNGYLGEGKVIDDSRLITLEKNVWELNTD